MHVIISVLLPFSSQMLDSVAVAIFAGIASERYIEEGENVKVKKSFIIKNKKMVFLEGIVYLVASVYSKQLFRTAVDDVWDQYDANDNGVLEKDECRRMITDILETFGKEDCFNEQIFSDAFDHLDDDGDGDIEKEQV